MSLQGTRRLQIRWIMDKWRVAPEIFAFSLFGRLEIDFIFTWKCIIFLTSWTLRGEALPPLTGQWGRAGPPPRPMDATPLAPGCIPVIKEKVVLRRRCEENLKVIGLMHKIFFVFEKILWDNNSYCSRWNLARLETFSKKFLFPNFDFLMFRFVSKISISP